MLLPKFVVEDIPVQPMRRRWWKLWAVALLVVLACGEERLPVPGCPDQFPWNVGKLFEVTTVSGQKYIACNMHTADATFGGESPCTTLWLRGGGKARICETYIARPIMPDSHVTFAR